MIKKLALLLLLGPSSSAQAAPYFRPLDIHHPQVSAGACADPVNVGQSSQCTMVPIFTHSHNDGYLLIPGEDWTPLALGYSLSGASKSFALGPSANILPFMGELIGWLPTEPKNENVGFAFGPTLVYDPFAANGKGKGYFRLFAGASWSF